MIFLPALIAIHLFILWRFLFFPYPELFIYPYLTNQGLLPYKQIFDQHFPGLMFLPINLGNLGMTTPLIARFWHWGIIVLTHIFLFLVAKKILKSNKKALFANLLFLIWQPFFEGYVLWIDNFIPLFTLPAFYFLLKKKEIKNYFFGGLFLGIALVFKQTILPLLVLIGIYLLIRERNLKKIFAFSSGVVIPVFLLLGYIFKIGVWEDFYYWTFKFNIDTFSEMGRKYATYKEAIKILPLFGFSIGGLAYLLRGKNKNPALLTSLFLIGSLFFVYARFDFIHLQPALPFAILALSIFFFNWKKIGVFLGIVYLAFSFLFVLPFAIRHLRSNETLFFTDLEGKLVEKVGEYANEGDSVFAMGTTLHLNFLTKTLPPGGVFVFQFPWFMVEAEEKILEGIVSDPPKVVVRDKNATTGGMNLVQYMKEINEYVEENYETVEKIGGVEVMLPEDQKD